MKYSNLSDSEIMTLRKFEREYSAIIGKNVNLIALEPQEEN